MCVFQPFFFSNINICNPDINGTGEPLPPEYFPKSMTPFVKHAPHRHLAVPQFFRLMLRAVIEFVLLLSCTSAAGMAQNLGVKSRPSSLPSPDVGKK